MSKGKTKLTRQEAERLFEGLPAAKTSVSSRPENPFGPNVSHVVKRGDDESTLWKDNLISLLWNYFSKRASWLFSDTVAGAKASAMIYSLMLTCRACNVEPYAYLLHVLTELPQRPHNADVSDLLPFNFAKRQVAANPA